MGSDVTLGEIKEVVKKFQSTLPVWGATGGQMGLQFAGGHFNPRSPCGERLCLAMVSRWTRKFQSTLPVWGATTKFYAKNAKIYRFQSTLPVWGATRRGNHQLYQHQISIHAPRVGSDSINIGHSARRLNFNPRSPCGERLRQVIKVSPGRLFQSTLPVWGATLNTG